MNFFEKFRGDQMPVPRRASNQAIAFAWLGCFIAVACLALLSEQFDQLLIMAPFGATCLLVFGFPDVPFSQPRNVIGGHVLSSIVGLTFLALLGAHWWSLALAVATAVAVNKLTGLVHPPAGANAIVIFLAKPAWGFVLFPTLAGAVMIVLIALFYNNLTRSTRYPNIGERANMTSPHYDVIIIGGGASGLMCAITAGQRGRRVLVLEGSNKVGKKILMSGGGRCNFTNLDVQPKNFISNNSRFCISALKRYTQWGFIALVDKHQIEYAERDLGKLFCVHSAKDILNMLLAECSAAKVEIKTDAKVASIQSLLGGSSGGFSVDGLTCKSLVIATGGLSIPSMGASGFGYDVARQFGHTVLPTRAGLVPFTFSDKFKDVSERLSGLAVDADLSCESASFNEAILFTHRGLSGPAALQLSNYWAVGEPIYLNLFPTESQAELLDWLLSLKRTHPKSLLRTLLAEHPTVRLAKSLALELQTELWQKHEKTPAAQIPDSVLSLIGQGLQAWQQKPSGTEGYRTAEVTLGGVDTTELSSKTMESTLQSGLYFVGEVMDVSGHLGGYNFQWAWASGHAAGEVA